VSFEVLFECKKHYEKTVIPKANKGDVNQSSVYWDAKDMSISNKCPAKIIKIVLKSLFDQEKSH